MWRFLTYQFVHVNAQHLISNMVMQLFLGVPLELSQSGWLGTLKLLTLYTSGVLYGSVLGTLLPHPTKRLAGASAGVYALISAHLASLILNWKEDGKVFRNRKDNNKSDSHSFNPLVRSLLIFKEG